MKKKENKTLVGIGMVLFVLYVLLLFYFLFVAERGGYAFEQRTYHYNLVPFKEIMRFWKHRDNVGMEAMFLNIFGNVIGFLPLGVFLPVLFPRCQRGSVTILLCFEFSAVAEVIQLVTKVGCFDVDDLMLNTFGGCIGYLVFVVYRTIAEKRK